MHFDESRNAILLDAPKAVHANNRQEYPACNKTFRFPFVCWTNVRQAPSSVRWTVYQLRQFNTSLSRSYTSLHTHACSNSSVSGKSICSSNLIQAWNKDLVQQLKI